MFDPHMTFLEKALPGKSPGLRINLKLIKNRKMLKVFKNQFQPYEGIFDCKIDDNKPTDFDGTLFRLPLRNKGSSISDIVYTASEVRSLFEKIMKFSANMFIFNQSVVELKLFHLPKEVKNPRHATLLFEIKKELSRLLPSQICTNPSCPVTDAVSWKRSKSCGEKPLQLLDKNNIEVTQYSNKNFKTQDRRFNLFWLVSWSTAVEKKCLELSQTEIGALPLGAIAIPVGHTDIGVNVLSLSEVPYEYYQKGHLFFFLPLPIEHQFDFYINSQFTVSSDRKMLRVLCEDDKSTLMARWNECLFDDPITQALLYLLENIHSVGSLMNYHFEQLWPMSERENGVLDIMSKSFFRNVVQPNGYKVFERDGKWFNISQCIFLDSELLSSNVGPYAMEYLSQLSPFAVEVNPKFYDRLKIENEDLIDKLTVSKTDFFLKYFLPNLEIFKDNDRRNKLLCYAIKMNQEDINEWIKSNKCIPNLANGELRRPNELVDPSSFLAALFERTDAFFPEKIFSHHDILGEMRSIGLMHETLNNDLLLILINSIQKEDKRCNVCASNLAGNVIAYIINKLPAHKTIEKTLQQVKFIPVRKRPLKWPFDWLADSYSKMKSKKCKCHKNDNTCMAVALFECASDVFHSECESILGSVGFIFNEDVLIKSQIQHNKRQEKVTLQKLGMKYKDAVPWKFVVSQLDTIIEAYKRQTHQSSNPSIDSIIQEIYQYLDHSCSDHFDQISKSLMGKESVFVTNRFVCPSLIAKKDLPVKCHPYVFCLGETILKDFPSFVECLKVSEEFEPFALAMILQNIKNSQREQPLNVSEVQAVLNLLLCLKAVLQKQGICNAQTIVKDELLAIFGPDENGFLHECNLMCFNDFDDIEKTEFMVYSHKLLSPDIAEYFGVLPKKLRYIEDNSEDIEDFFQKEPLVIRLRRILDGFPCDTGLFKELIQNADDAEATEIYFIKDFLPRSSEKMAGSGFEHVQVPSLCIFNNSAFSKEDLAAITKLGEGNKANDSAKTGHYGIGFNAVYNLTDVPSFYTFGGDIENKETLCYFDPLAAFFPLVTREKPGKRIKNLKALRNVQSNIMASYHEILTVQSGKGTVFRLPLRLRSSEINDDVITIEALSKLLENLREELGEMLIFLKHLKYIRILTWTDGEYKEDYSVRIQLDTNNSLARERVFHNFYDLSNITKKDKMAAFQFTQQSEVYEISLLESQPGKKCHIDYIVAMTVGFNQTAKYSDILRDRYRKGKVELLPFGGVAVSVEKHLKGIRRKNRKSDSPVFCFLPLPVATKLPVLVNGYFCLDNETRRNIWGSGNIDEMKWRTQWNVLITEKVVTTAYVKLLDYTKDKIFSHITNRVCDPVAVRNAIEHFQDFFPVTNELTDYWKILGCSVYKALVENKSEFLPMQETETNIFAVKRTQCKLSWTSLYVAKHDYPAFVNAETVNRQVPELTNSSKLNTLLRKVGMRIVFLMDSIIRSMEESGNKISPLTPDNVIEFLCSWSGGAVDKCKLTPRLSIAETPLVTVENAHVILKYCLESVDTFIENILDIPLFVTEDLDVLSLKEEMPRYVDKTGMYCLFFPCQKNKFIHKVIAKSLAEKCGEQIFESQNILQPFHMKDFVELAKLAKTIPTDCKTWISWDHTYPSKEWVRQFWEFFQAELQSDLSVPHVKSLLQVVDSIPLIAVEVNNLDNDYLVPPHDIRRIISLESFQNNHNLHAGLTKLDLPLVQKALFVNSKNDILTVYKALSEIMPNIQDASGVLECLFLHLEKICEIRLDYANTEPILQFFDGGFGRDGELLTKELIDKLKHLPLFKSHFGKLVKLSDYRTIHIVPFNIRSEGLEELANAIKVLFLEDVPLKRLFKRLKIVELPIIDVYTKYIIPHHKKLKRINFYRHLEFISMRDEFNDDTREAKELISMLRETPFVEMPDHRFVKVNKLYDPFHKVFIAMCEKRELLPRNLRKKSLVNLFKRIGLNDKMTMSLFVRFASDIEAKGNSDRLTGDIIERSHLLTKHLLEADDEFIQKENFSRLSDIHFVVPGTVNQNLSDIHAQFAEEKLLKFNGSYLSSSENVCWTVGNILLLPISMTDLKPKVADQFCKHLSICLKPDRLTLLKHLKNVGQSVQTKINTCCFTSNMIETVPKIFKDIYEALNTDMNSHQHTSEVSDSPVIYFPISKMILQPKMVVLACAENQEVRPYFCKCPNEYGMFHSLFSNLGVHKEPTCTAYSSVLFKIKAKVEKNSDGLTSDDCIDAIKATGNFLKLLSQQSDKVVTDEDHLYLMSRQNTLENSQCLLVSNNQYFEDQLLKNGISRNRFLVGVDKLKDFHLHTNGIVDSLQWLTEVHRPHILTDIVHEQVVLENVLNKDGKIAKRLQNFISSRHFMLGVLRLVCHVRKFQRNQFLDRERDKIISDLQSITFVHCSNIQTVIAMREIENGKLGQFRKIDNTTEIKYAHLEKTENGACIYFDTADRDWFGSVQKLLTLYLNKEKGLNLQDEYQMRIEEIIGMFESPHRIDRHLSKHKIDEYHFELDAEDTSNIPIVGNYVPEDLYQYLDNNYDHIDESEYKFMALEIDDPLYYIDRYRNSSHIDATYIFVHIIRKVEPYTALHLLQEYEIDDGTDSFKIVRAHKLYKFTHKPKEWDQNQSVKDVCKKIKEHLIIAWKKPEKERKSIVKRLLFKWHPDKNRDNQEFCTKVFQFIQQCINALENGTELPREEDEGAPRSSPTTTSSSSRFHWEDSWYDHWEQHYRSRWRRPRNRNFADRYEFWTSYRYCYTERRPYKWFSEAHRWLKQAMYDFNDAKLSKMGPSTAFNWICYRAYQAVKKALLAAWYATDAYKAGIRKHYERISLIAEGLDPQLSSLAERLEKLTGSCEKMLYPNDFGLPQDLYIKENAEVAIVISDSVIKKVNEKYNIM